MPSPLTFKTLADPLTFTTVSNPEAMSNLSTCTKDRTPFHVTEDLLTFASSEQPSAALYGGTFWWWWWSGGWRNAGSLCINVRSCITGHVSQARRFQASWTDLFNAGLKTSWVEEVLEAPAVLEAIPAVEDTNERSQLAVRMKNDDLRSSLIDWWYESAVYRHNVYRKSCN